MPKILRRRLWDTTGLFALLALLILFLFPAAAYAAGGVRVEWMKGTNVLGAETVTSSGASVASSAAPSFGGVAGTARFSVTEGAVIVYCCAPSPTATQTNGFRLQAGDAPFVVNGLSGGTKFAVIEATDPATGGGGGGGGGGAVTVSDGADVAQGDRDDAAWSGTGAGTLVAITKAVRNVLAEIRDATSAVPVTDNGGSLTVDGTVAVSSLPSLVLAAGTNNIGDVDVLTLPNVTLNSMGAQGTGATFDPPTGGSGLLGYLSGIFKAVTGVVQVGGNAAHNAADSGFPVKIGCVYNTALPSLSNGFRSDVQCSAKGGLHVVMQDSSGNYIAGVLSPGDGRGDTTDRKLGVLSYGTVFNGTSWDRAKGSLVGTATQPYGIRSSRWSYAAASGGIVNTTTAVTIAPAAGAGLRNCLVSLDLMAEALGTATELAIRDGAGGTVIYRTKIGTTGLPGRDVNLDAPICGTANTLLEAVTLTASGTGAVYLNATGNIEP